jgi:hypothetical protein
VGTRGGFPSLQNLSVPQFLYLHAGGAHLGDGIGHTVCGFDLPGMVVTVAYPLTTTRATMVTRRNDFMGRFSFVFFLFG